MSQIFLSASIPQQGRGDFFESADPFLIQFAVREFMTVCLANNRRPPGSAGEAVEV